MKALPGRILGCRFFASITLNISCHSLLACRISAEKSANSLMGVPLYVICCSFLHAFNILSLSLIFAILITMCLGVVLFGLILFRTLYFLDLDVCFLSQVREVFSHYYLQICSKYCSTQITCTLTSCKLCVQQVMLSLLVNGRQWLPRESEVS